MPRPTTKNELITAANDGWDKLWSLIDSIPDGAQSVVFDFGDDPKLKEAHWKRDKNLRDVLVHLYEWQVLLLKWVCANMDGQECSFLPTPYTWKNYGGMNMEFWHKHQDTSYDEAEMLLRSSRSRVMSLIESLTNNELFEKKHFPWTGTTCVGAYCISATSAHYEWAMKKIKTNMKAKKNH